jgi:hypothetical protein
MKRTKNVVWQVWTRDKQTSSLTYLLTYSMEQRLSWEANWSSAGQGPHFMETEGSLLHSKVLAACPYPEPDQSRPCPVPMLEVPTYILPSTPGSSKWSLSLRFPHQNPVCSYHLAIRATCPAYFILLDFIARTIVGEQCRSLSSADH